LILPNPYLVGAPKAGTTTVANCLGQHPEVYWPAPKEPYYWAADYPRMRKHYGFGDRASYERLYSRAEASTSLYRGDGSTTYLYSANAIPDICEAVPDARFLVCVRDPVDLVISYHRTQLVALNESEPDFGRAWHRHRDGGLPDTDPLDDKRLDYATVGGIGTAMDRMLRVVPRERVHVIVFDDLVLNPRRTWKALAAYLHIDSGAAPSFAAANASDKVARLAELLKRDLSAWANA
jgi:Sulfotransferase family